MTTWLDQVHELDALDVARALGMIPATSERVLTECPACGAERRSRGDRRAPVDVDRRKGAWHCKACGIGGGVLDLVAHRLDGAAFRDLGAAGKDRVHDWFADRFGLPSRHGGTGGGTKAPPMTPRPKPSREPVPPPSRPAAAEVEALWRSCRAVTDDADVAGWLAARGLESAVIADRDLARALPTGARSPSWARFRGRPWYEQGYRLVVPVYGATGALESLRARAVTGRAPKSVAAAAGPGSAQGLVMADQVAREVLATGKRPDVWPDGKPLRVVVVEGEPDFLTWATRFGDAAEDAPAVFGIESGSWTPAIAARVPNGARVTVRTHHDLDEKRTGDRYAEVIRASLAGRCTVLRGGVRRGEQAA